MDSSQLLRNEKVNTFEGLFDSFLNAEEGVGNRSGMLEKYPIHVKISSKSKNFMQSNGVEVGREISVCIFFAKLCSIFTLSVVAGRRRYH